MYPNFLKDLESGKMFPVIGAGRLLNIQVILDDKIIYEGPIEEASTDIKKLYYYKTNVNGGKFLFYVDSEMCKMINERNRQNNSILESKKIENVIISNEEKKEEISVINNKEADKKISAISHDEEKPVVATNEKETKKNVTNTKITKDDVLVENVDKKFKVNHRATTDYPTNLNPADIDFSDSNIKDMSETELDRDIRILFNQEMNRYGVNNPFEPLYDYDDYRKNNPRDLEKEG